jgi:L-ribulose-5-phosphate 3-epimerase
MKNESKHKIDFPLNRRGFLAFGAGSVVANVSGMRTTNAAEVDTERIITPPKGKRILLSCKLGMIPKELNGQKLSIVERLQMAHEAGFDGVDFDQAGEYTPQEAKLAVQKSGVFVHNAINHAHWSQRLTSAGAGARLREHRALHSGLTCDWRQWGTDCCRTRQRRPG